MAASDPESHSADLLGWFDSPGPGRPLLLIAGPCMLEDREVNLRIGSVLKEACSELGIQFVFKASFDKANRSSIDSPRGPGLYEGLEALAELREHLQVPTCTDIHQPEQAEPAGQVVQSDGAVAPVVLRYEPASQGVGALTPDSQYQPAGQSMQSDRATLPTASE